jgi:hypothetical protein
MACCDSVGSRRCCRQDEDGNSKIWVRAEPTEKEEGKHEEQQWQSDFSQHCNTDLDALMRIGPEKVTRKESSN